MNTLRRRILWALAFGLCAASASAQIGTVTATAERGRDRLADLACTTIVWATDASAEASAEVTSIRGTISRLVVIPSTASAPSDDYSVTLTDRDGFDVLNGLGATLNDTGASQETITGDALNTIGNLTFDVTSVGSTAEGTVRVFWRP